MNDELRELGAVVGQHIGTGPDDEQLRLQRHRALTAFAEARSRRSAPRARWIAWGAGTVAIAAAAAIAVFVAGSQPERVEATLRCRDGAGVERHAGEWIAAGEAALALRFTDRSEMTIDSGSRLRLEQIADDRVRVSLEDGRLSSHVRSPRRAVQWTFLAGPFHVEVLGTSLSIDWAPGAGRVVVEVYRGTVRVRRGAGDAEGVRVSAGERFEASIAPGFVLRPIRSARSDEAQRIEAPADANAPADPAQVAATRGAESADDSVRAGARTDQRDPREEVEPWVRLAQQGDYAEALAAAREVGLDEIAARASARDVLLLGDAARFAGEHEQARAILMTVRERFARTPSATMAAFRLGRLAFDRREYRDAVRWFATYRREAPDGELVEQAHGRKIEALLRSGHRRSARVVARSYLETHPNGSYRELANHALAEDPL
jgi:hypothetical protein